jgi:uncharacterized Zn-binding protein involved in type VI secretion
MTPILHEGATVVCPHLPSTTQAMTASSRVAVAGGQRVVTTAHGWTVMTCNLSTTSTPPCVSGKFSVGSSRVQVEGQPVATLQSTGTCKPRPADVLSAQQAQTRVLVAFP